jgi:hypothetical protein
MALANGPFKPKDKVNVFWQGQWYKGEIEKPNPDFTYAVKYDDGDKDDEVIIDNIRHQYKKGDKVVCWYTPSWWGATIEADNGDFTYHVKYEDGDEDKTLHIDDICDGWDANDEVSVLAEDHWWGAKIAKVNNNAGVITYDVKYDDGEEDKDVSVDYIRDFRTDDCEELKEKDAVVVYYTQDKHWYTGKVSKVHGDAVYDVAYDDGDKDEKLNVPLYDAASKVQAFYER